MICGVDGGGCFPPDSEVASIVAGALAPVAFAVGLIGLLCAVLLRVFLAGVLEKMVAGLGPEVATWKAPRSAESFDQFKPPLSR